MAAEQVTAWLVRAGEHLDPRPRPGMCCSLLSHQPLKAPSVFQGLERVPLGMSPVPFAWRLSCLGTPALVGPGVSLPKNQLVSFTCMYFAHRHR